MNGVLELAELINEFNKLKYEVDRYKFIIKHKDVFALLLDYDCTSVILLDKVRANFLYGELYGLPEIDPLDEILLNCESSCCLLAAIGVKYVRRRVQEY